MSEIAIHSARYADAANTLIDISLTCGGETFDFTLAPDDSADLAGQLRAILAGNPVTIAAYAAPPEPIPQAVSRQQMMSALMLAGLITETEWLACYQSGTLPALVAAAIATLPTAPERLVAKVKWVEFSEARRDDAMVALLAAQAGLTDVQVDDLFRTAAAL